MKQQDQYPGWFLWMYEKGFGLFLLIGTLLFALILWGAIYLDGRLDTIEGRLEQIPPNSYQPPKPDDFPVGDVDLESLPIRQWVYVPVYSHIYYLGGSPYRLETTLSIRNVDPDQPIYLTDIDYYGTDGKLVKNHLEKTIKLAPLQTIEYLVPSRDSSGGSGANYLVHWLAEDGTNKPLIEAIMVGTAGTQAICFSRAGVEISSPNGQHTQPE